MDRKKIVFVIGIYAILIVLVRAEVILNRSIKKIIRIKLNKKMKIKGAGRGYYLKLPVSIRVDDDGNIYILDGSSGGWRFYEILKFGKNGRFQKRIVRRGQGPGEAVDINNFFIKRKKIYIYDLNMEKMIIKNLNGNLIREFRIKKTELKLRRRLLISFVSVYNDKFLFRLNLTNFTTKKTSIIYENNFFCVYRNKEWKINKVNFLKSIYFIRGTNGVIGIIPIGNLNFDVFKNKYIFINNTSEYSVKLYDMENDKIMVEFRRKYDRVKKTIYDEKEKGGVMIADKWYYKPHQKYYDDIQKLLVHGDKLWVITSTTDKKKGVLTDVFTEKGLFINKFYLKLTNEVDYKKIDNIPMEISGDYLYTVERDKNDEPVIIKYKIPNKKKL